jgi:hypothetical protein
VPLPFGRPLGVPGDPAFQHRVIGAALSLLKAEAGPVLANCDEDVPDTTSDPNSESWVCPASFPSVAETETLRGRLSHEQTALAPWYEHAVTRRGRTTTAVTGLDIQATTQSLVDWVEEDIAPSSDPAALPNALRLRCEDLKSYYLEAATAQPGEHPLSSVQRWFWEETEAAKLLRLLASKCQSHSDEKVQFFGKLMVVPRQFAAE